MDPHSRLSQFNNRPPKGLPPAARHMDPTTPKLTLPIERPKSASSSKPAKRTSTAVSRPIATNSRVKQSQQFHRDLHLAYVNNALEQKSAVRVKRSTASPLY
jgi:RNA polymerase I-specific transcription initiation factor RRN3